MSLWPLSEARPASGLRSAPGPRGLCMLLLTHSFDEAQSITEYNDAVKNALEVSLPGRNILALREMTLYRE